MTSGRSDDTVETLRLRIRDLELATDWYLQRIHELEAHLGHAVPATAETTRTAPREPEGADGGVSERHLERVRLFEGQLARLERESAEKERVIAELAAAVEQLRGELEEKERVIADLAAACEERQAVIDRLSPAESS